MTWTITQGMSYAWTASEMNWSFGQLAVQASMSFWISGVGWVTSTLLQRTSVSMAGSWTVATKTSAPRGEFDTKTPLKPNWRAALSWSFACPLTMAQMMSGLAPLSEVITGMKSVVPQGHFSTATTSNPLCGRLQSGTASTMSS